MEEERIVIVVFNRTLIQEKCVPQAAPFDSESLRIKFL